MAEIEPAFKIWLKTAENMPKPVNIIRIIEQSRVKKQIKTLMDFDMDYERYKEYLKKEGVWHV